jgi:hypothetical protein
MNIEFKSLSEVNAQDIIDLMNSPLVRRQMPLLKGEFTATDCENFVSAKTQMWKEHGYGPWAFVIDNQFAGWGGVQPEEGEADLALVLHPNFWGTGKTLYAMIVKKAFVELGLDSIQVLFPTTRTRVEGLLKLGFTKDKELSIGKEPFIRYVLKKPEKSST